MNEIFETELLKRFYSNKGEEKRVLKGLKALFECPFYKVAEKNDSYNESLYHIACSLEDLGKGLSEYDVFTDYPLCNQLSFYYDDFSFFCKDLANDLIYQNMDLSNLNNIKKDLAKNMICVVLENFKKNTEQLLKDENFLEQTQEIETNLPRKVRRR